jgi:predicted alpha/beta superfamily hydrolase
MLNALPAILLLLIAWGSDPARASVERQSTVTGQLVIHADFRSEVLNNARAVRVWLPPGYQAERPERYPVLYMHDGQNLFDDATSFVGEWKIDETLTRLIEAESIEPIIVVGIDNMGLARVAEYTVDRGRVRDSEAGGRGSDYMRFIVEELKPFIDSTYATRTDRASTMVGGSSLGGLISLDLAIAYPEVFARAAVISPSLWWADRATLKRVERQVERLKSSRLWIDMGTLEGDVIENRPNVHLQNLRDLAAILRAGNIDHHSAEVDGAGHNERAWSARFEQIILYLLNN